MLIQLSINSYLNTKFKEIIKKLYHIKNCLKFFASFRGSVKGCCSCSTESFPNNRANSNGEVGTSMCLNDLITFHENNKGIPNDVDKMFVIGLE